MTPEAAAALRSFGAWFADLMAGMDRSNTPVSAHVIAGWVAEEIATLTRGVPDELPPVNDKLREVWQAFVNGSAATAEESFGCLADVLRELHPQLAKIEL